MVMLDSRLLRNCSCGPMACQADYSTLCFNQHTQRRLIHPMPPLPPPPLTHQYFHPDNLHIVSSPKPHIHNATNSPPPQPSPSIHISAALRSTPHTCTQPSHTQLYVSVLKQLHHHTSLGRDLTTNTGRLNTITVLDCFGVHVKPSSVLCTTAPCTAVK
ncbi:hypothetical protein Hamer_G008940 [Homarus americanus]|uniref:Uncharacterized protein n=1 Tax=Homarus americanus TaxID=6706 RepID=A0A8J5JHN4_HOMAM|nr:hypothetical protein Hamer_G008940 [Homarus americanus]